MSGTAGSLGSNFNDLSPHLPYAGVVTIEKIVIIAKTGSGNWVGDLFNGNDQEVFQEDGGLAKFTVSRQLQFVMFSLSVRTEICQNVSLGGWHLFCPRADDSLRIA